MQSMYYIGLDVHKRTISYCVKDGSGKIHAEGTIPATRFDLDRWMRTLPQPWTAAMEATVFTGWIYDQLLPHAAALKVAHPLMLRAIAAAKKKNDRIDASKICDCLRCDFLPECYMASTAIRERRRTLRYRNLPQREVLAMLFLNLHFHGLVVGEIFFGLWLVPLALLVYRSRFLPRFLGVWLALGGLGWVILGLTGVVPQYSQVFATVALRGWRSCCGS